jgi:hypothetical protein
LFQFNERPAHHISFYSYLHNVHYFYLSPLLANEQEVFRRVEHWRSSLRPSLSVSTVSSFVSVYIRYSPISSVPSKIPYIGFSHSTASSSGASKLAMSPSLYICYKFRLTHDYRHQMNRFDPRFETLVVLTSLSQH